MDNLKSIVSQLDAKAPKVEQVDYSIMEMILNSTDFTGCATTMDAMNLFYERLWASVVFPARDQEHILQREVGRLILECDQWKRRAEKAEAEEAAREDVPAQGYKYPQTPKDIPFC